MQKISCYETKTGIKRNAVVTHDSSHRIVGESLLTVSEGTAAKFPKLNSLKRTIQRQRVLAAPIQPLSLVELEIPMEYRSTAKGEMFYFTIRVQIQKGFSLLGRVKILRC